jgi:hypothetical protein
MIALEKNLGLRNEYQIFKLNLDFISFEGYLMDGEYLWDEPAKEIIKICDEEGKFEVDKRLRKEIKKQRINVIREENMPNLRCTSRNIKVKLICYKPISDNERERFEHPVYFTPKEYIALGRPEIIEEEVTRRYSPSKNN